MKVARLDAGMTLLLVVSSALKWNHVLVVVRILLRVPALAPIVSNAPSSL
jgi:hypothetical protein